jgi:hydrogenase expression/formation protein HypC
VCLGIPGQIISIVDEVFQIASVEIGGVRRGVSLALVAAEGVAPGDWVLVHVGFAMSKINEQEAQETLHLLTEMGAAYSDELRLLQESQAARHLTDGGIA